MATTLTNLIPDVYAALDVVSRELVGLIPSVTIDAQASRAAVNQTVRTFVAPAASAADITAAVTPPDDGNQTIGNKTLSITKARRVPIRWTGEEERSSAFSAPQIRQAQFAQAMRTLVNEVEADLAALHAKASRAYGTAGTTPFGTANDYTDAAMVRKILADNGAPLSDLYMLINTTAGANFRGKQGLFSTQGDASMLRQGVLLDINGMAVRESHQILTPSVGNAAGAKTTTSGAAIGATTINLVATGTGAVTAGDIITFSGDTATKYVVTSGCADVSSGGSITIGAPGLLAALPASSVAITVVGSATRNMVFSRNAIVLAARLPALPADGDVAVDRTTITDPRSGLSFELSLYAQYRQMQYELSLAWGAAVIKPEHLALLLG